MSDGSVPKPADPPGGPRALVSNRQSLPLDEAGLASLAERTLRAEGRTEGELSLSFVEPAEMERLHVRFMDEPGPTDVLSFPLDEEGLIGDVVVCPVEAARNREDLGAELRLLVVHGVLHLLGYDHQTEEDRRVMWDRQAAHSGVSA
jgi:probable rRNA maturation factor